MTVPFADSKMPEVCARVAYQWVVLCYRQSADKTAPGPEHIIAALDRLPLAQNGLIRSALLAMLFAQRKRVRAAQWLSRAILNSRAGYGFRRCWYDEYKAHRRDPRVTNRGVTPSA